MSVEPLTHPVDRSGLHDSLREICATQEESHRFFSEMFDQLDTLSAELLRRREAWQADRQRAEDEFQERAAALEQRQAELAAEREQFRQKSRQELAQAAAAGAENGGQLQEMLEEAERERAALRGALETAQSQVSRLADVAAELAESRSELSGAREEIRRQREQLNTVRNEVSQPQPDPQLQEQLGRMEKERAVLDQERLVVETELETVRNRAAEMAEALAEQKRQTADERVRWANELKRMRRLMETLSQQQVEYHRSSEAHRPNGQPQPRESSEPMQPVAATAAPNDPVLGSVVAQFEMLQKDLARRRRNRCDAKPST